MGQGLKISVNGDSKGVVCPTRGVGQAWDKLGQGLRKIVVSY